MTHPEEPFQFGATRAHPLGPPAAEVTTQYDAFVQPGPPLAGGYLGPPSLPPKRRHTGLIIGIIVAAVVLLATAGTATAYLTSRHSVLPGASSTFHVPGTLTINGVGCGGIGYGDLQEGTEVTLTDETGKVLAVGQLARTSTCSFTFSLEAPTGKKFYGVTISHRGTVHYTEDELRHGLQLSIG